MKKYFAMFFGSFFVSIGINGFIIPHHLLDGGVIGLSLLLKYTFGTNIGLTILIISFPIYLFAWFYFRMYFMNAIQGLLASTLFIDLLAPVHSWWHWPVYMSAVWGGLFIGIGVGIMLRNHTGTGAIDLLAQCLASVTSIHVSYFILAIDAVIILSGGFVLGGGSLMYSMIVIIIVAIVTNLIMRVRAIHILS
ncbi:YitT family protein [Bacillaceae bacterium SIJ1]|uniref:YitT family protein n=1 Tax=Litoribacterium kuwaitense TaxID=1398745 RepID=UPI0013EE2AA8|nr:YitT family protein [Litoribacterium kuwaitense]NGP43988.1 YitT family protein [Litoribacterium kuwaitense]